MIDYTNPLFISTSFYLIGLSILYVLVINKYEERVRKIIYSTSKLIKDQKTIVENQKKLRNKIKRIDMIFLSLKRKPNDF